MKAWILVFGIVFISILIAGFIIYTNSQASISKTSPKTALPASVKEYLDSNYNFSFSYPNKYLLTSDLNTLILNGKMSNEKFQLIGSVSTTSGKLRSGSLSILSICRSLLTRSCLIDSQSVFTNIEGTTGTLYYFSTATSSALFKKELKGPLYAFSLPAINNHKAGLLFFYFKDLEATEVENNVLKGILDTLSIPLPAPTKSTEIRAISTSPASSSAK